MCVWSCAPQYTVCNTACYVEQCQMLIKFWNLCVVTGTELEQKNQISFENDKTKKQKNAKNVNLSVQNVNCGYRIDYDVTSDQI